MRCSLLHQGMSGGATFSRLLFVAAVNGNVFHNNTLNDALNLDLPTFCRDVLDAVRRWREDVRETEAFTRNAPTVIQWHPQGLAPYIVGVPVLG